MSLARLLQLTGAHADNQQACADLFMLRECSSRSRRPGQESAQIRKATMDIGFLHQHCVDFTIHNPFVHSCH